MQRAPHILVDASLAGEIQLQRYHDVIKVPHHLLSLRSVHGTWLDDISSHL